MRKSAYIASLGSHRQPWGSLFPGERWKEATKYSLFDFQPAAGGQSRRIKTPPDLVGQSSSAVGGGTSAGVADFGAARNDACDLGRFEDAAVDTFIWCHLLPQYRDVGISTNHGVQRVDAVPRIAPCVCVFPEERGSQSNMGDGSLPCRSGVQSITSVIFLGERVSVESVNLTRWLPGRTWESRSRTPSMRQQHRDKPWHSTARSSHLHPPRQVFPKAARLQQP